ncbi:DUF4625 domain-containing protein [Marinifilum flexuosum]|uniref:DUF4625 domain-containing protein n=1 Tax=Marinifilum flexuosum TaxID=1117708 RepID=UPI0024957368|nr:DUF4625 domain-containing protein [Marinifilum flexuosum]
MKLLKYALMVLFSVGMISCGGGGSDPVDESKPTASISSPGATVEAGDNFNVSFSASDDMGLDSYRVQISLLTQTGMTVKTYQKFSFDSNSDKTDANDDLLPQITKGDKTAQISFPVSTSFGENTVAEKGMYKIIITVTDTADKTNSIDKTFTIQ